MGCWMRRCWRFSGWEGRWVGVVTETRVGILGLFYVSCLITPPHGINV